MRRRRGRRTGCRRAGPRRDVPSLGPEGEDTAACRTPSWVFGLALDHHPGADALGSEAEARLDRLQAGEEADERLVAARLERLARLVGRPVDRAGELAPLPLPAVRAARRAERDVAEQAEALPGGPRRIEPQPLEE